MADTYLARTMVWVPSQILKCVCVCVFIHYNTVEMKILLSKRLKAVPKNNLGLLTPSP